MTSIQDKGFGESDAESIGQDADSADDSSSPPVKMGRPKQNPHAEDKKLTFRIPADLHRKLRYASVDLDAYSGEVGHAFQSKPAGYSGGSRPPIPVIPATLVGA